VARESRLRRRDIRRLERSEPRGVWGAGPPGSGPCLCRCMKVEGGSREPGLSVGTYKGPSGASHGGSRGLPPQEAGRRIGCLPLSMYESGRRLERTRPRRRDIRRPERSEPRGGGLGGWPPRKKEYERDGERSTDENRINQS
jgi:hypothetical protein